VASHDALYRGHGYYRAPSMDYSYRPNTSKVVMYGKPVQGGYQVTHTALQTPNGWTSKLGEGPVIWHPTPEVVSGPLFGYPIAVYSRPR
jgi:hypothetical protein